MMKEIVTVAVITYNSSKTVIETLDSIIDQTYGANSIELIISDDASIDDTVSVIDRWLEEHRSFFHSVLFFKNTINIGVSGNVNITWKSATSEWVKTIAGDDILFPSCLYDNVNYVRKTKDVSVLFSEMEHFRVSDNGESEIIATSPPAIIKCFFELSASEQLEKLCIENFVPAPSSFINLEILKCIGYADEKFKLIEDYPLWLKLTSSGYKLSFLDKKTVYYRISNSLSSNVTRLINFNFFSDLGNVYTSCVYPKLSNNKPLIIQKKTARALTFFVAKGFKNKRNRLSIFIMRIIYLISPKHVKVKDLLMSKFLRIHR